MAKVLAMVAVCVAMAGCGAEDRHARAARPAANAEVRVSANVWVRPYVDRKTGVEWLVFRHYSGGIAVVQRQPLPAPPSEGE